MKWSFEATHREAVYRWVTEALCELEYWKQKRAARGTLRQYIGKMTGLSWAQVARLIGRYKESGKGKMRFSSAPPRFSPPPPDAVRAILIGCSFYILRFFYFSIKSKLESRWTREETAPTLERGASAGRESQ